MNLSFSTLNILHTCPHNFLNKAAGIKRPEKPEWAEGKACHRVIQDHVAGIKLDDRLKHIKRTFSVVEQVEFDPRCRFEFKFGSYVVTGYVDGRQDDYSSFLEIKTSSNPWSITKFKKSKQRKVYALSNKRYKKAIIITGQRDMGLWKVDPPKAYSVPVTDKDRKDAGVWIQAGIEILEKGDFLTDLEIIDGRPTCTDKWCWWGLNCMWKRYEV